MDNVAAPPKRLVDFSFDLSKKESHLIHMFHAGAMVHVYQEDAILLHRLLGYKLVLMGQKQPYIKVGFAKRSLNQINQRIRETIKLGVKIWERKGEELVPVTHIPPKNKDLRKRDFVEDGELQTIIADLQDAHEQEVTISIAQMKHKSQPEFLLHSKTKDAFQATALSVARYLPKMYRSNLGNSYINAWVDVVKLINKLRNIPIERADTEAYLTHKVRLCKTVSEQIDTLKDISEIIYAAHGFKNQQQYQHIHLRLSELGKMTQGIGNKASVTIRENYASL